MAVDHIRYDLLAQDALRGVVRTVLIDAATKGLPGEHHFYISFDTRAEGVRLSPRMLAQYPEEMTVVLQHQFWDLVVTDDGFEVGLSFGGIAERLAVPFAAIKGFFDPSVQFGLQFEEIERRRRRSWRAGKRCPPRPPRHRRGRRPSTRARAAARPPWSRHPPIRRQPARAMTPTSRPAARRSCGSTVSGRNRPAARRQILPRRRLVPGVTRYDCRPLIAAPC